MPRRGEPLRKLGFLTIGRFDAADPRPGLEETLQVVELAEQLGFDSVWLRCRHLQPGISSPVAIMAAATQRTSRIELGTAVIPLGLENPLRLAEDLATVDLLSGGRINPGVSVGTPMLYDHYKAALYPSTHDTEDFSKERVLRLVRALRGDPVSDFSGTLGIEQFTDHVQPHSPGLVERIWYGGGRDSAVWAGRHGLNYLTSSVVSIEGTDSRDFATIQAEHIDAYRAVHTGNPRVSQGLVVIPTDSATDEQVRRYRNYAASRFERTKEPQGPRGMLFSPDYVGPSSELAELLYEHAGFQRADEVTFALPFTFASADYTQIISDLAAHLGPALGWTPTV
ncbi:MULTISPECIES: LLM class flavin-dependent oxidoreductase [Mycobacteriaceae]|uniref:Luciferase n=1 Tax=Mycolicibacterium neoaurum VKM Ac-1815D TaxID=700508 RepID=V5XDM1_MYCNE|nr:MULTISPECIES: LLM class flavin-dependent oxidoreductase [Mycobacteriaceae]AHC25928.1 luciferase [Mycolicibacterium neoaurum VKM Ac-1815D]AMO06333.1 luciferase [Mycolicibacterium neoaurum]AXK75321.1 LLM class flavin-dependent oxidoreductase [Mycolicibacterium neoaurum]KJQ51006.1 luciferase [Mycolicibacterium neoaurum]KUM08313.1 luciferase [Mycolicibacterium neoaurum]